MYTLILGFDSFDPTTFEKLLAQGKLPNLGRLAEAGKYARLQVSDPPQTEVSWTSIATGQDPGGHGIFDFVHRDPKTYQPFVSLLPTRRSRLGVEFAPPFSARTMFDEAADMGYPSTALWWPGLFPARPESPVRTIPGLGAPDILGKLGVGTLLTTDPEQAQMGFKTAVIVLEKNSSGDYRGSLDGPLAKQAGKAQPARADLYLALDDDTSARLRIGEQTIPLGVGCWSPIFEVKFKMGFLMSVRAVTRAVLTETSPYIKVYLLPLQIHPLAPLWRYASPPSLARQLWQIAGPYLTLGWPQDTTGLDEGHLSDKQFLDLCSSISDSRERALFHLIDSFREGLLAIIFDDLDRIQHMFRRDQPEVLEEWYVRLDSLVKRVDQALSARSQGKARLIVLSDHGFSAYDYNVHLNAWLAEKGYLFPSQANHGGGLDQVDWSRTQAYAVGLNSLYLNQQHREGKGIVSEDQASNLFESLRRDLLTWRGPDDRPVVQRVLTNKEAYTGPLAPYGPDMIIGYTSGYRASPDTGLGRWKAPAIEPNAAHWGADHCIDSQAVPGVLFCSHGLGGLTQPTFRDIPALAIGRTVKQTHMTPPQPPSSSGVESQEAIEERLKSLGYL